VPFFVTICQRAAIHHSKWFSNQKRSESYDDIKGSCPCREWRCCSPVLYYSGLLTKSYVR
jgi:hypothetical protein